MGWLTLVLAAAMALRSSGALAAEPALVLQGRGVQIYHCTQSDGAYAWRLQAPDAVLTDTAGSAVGHHFAGPSWQHADGSIVVGEPVATSAAPQAGAIPWLVLRAKSHAGAGRFAKISYIVRSTTEGGVAPPDGCDQAHGDAEVKVEYSATYTLFSEQ